MGKAGKWFRSLLSSKKSPSPKTEAPPEQERSEKGKRGSSKSVDKFKNVEKNPLASPYHEGLDANKHAIAVAAATAAVAEAALAAAQAAAEVVKLTSGGVGSRGGERRRVVAAVRIQSAFRAYLAKRALRALKGLVKLQAHVRGHIVRKQSADMLRRMQAMARIQARASVNRAYPIESSYTKINSVNSHRQGIMNLRKHGERSNIVKHGESTRKQYNSRPYGTNNNTNKQHQIASNWLDHWMERNAWNNNQDDERNDKILEIDTWKPRHNARRNDKNTIVPSQHVPSWNDSGVEYPKISSFSRLQEKLQKPNPSVSSEDVSSVISEKFPLSASSRPTSNMRGPFTPTRSECSRSVFGDYMGHPSYMANTESSRAKVRSQSAPKQRMQLEELNLSWKFGRGLLEPDVVSEKGSTQPFNYKNNAYNSSNFRRQGSSIYDVGYGYSSSYGHRL